MPRVTNADALYYLTTHGVPEYRARDMLQDLKRETRDGDTPYIDLSGVAHITYSPATGNYLVHEYRDER